MDRQGERTSYEIAQILFDLSSPASPLRSIVPGLPREIVLLIFNKVGYWIPWGQRRRLLRTPLDIAKVLHDLTSEWPCRRALPRAVAVRILDEAQYWIPASWGRRERRVVTSWDTGAAKEEAFECPHEVRGGPHRPLRQIKFSIRAGSNDLFRSDMGFDVALLRDGAVEQRVKLHHPPRLVRSDEIIWGQDHELVQEARAGDTIIIYARVGLDASMEIEYLWCTLFFGWP